MNSPSNIDMVCLGAKLFCDLCFVFGGQSKRQFGGNRTDAAFAGHKVALNKDNKNLLSID